jgi:methylenetetrahydrofolate dehydrogenase (NADP+)/methenyltetrahydrofolate cyclohydrolase
VIIILLYLHLAYLNMEETKKPKLLIGKNLAQAVARSLRQTISENIQAIGRSPGLAVILVGDDPASKTYVASKHRFAKECGVITFDAPVAADISAKLLSEIIDGFNNDPNVDGILLQLPLPKPLDGAHFTRLISPKKDADGLHPLNQGLLLQGLPAPRACTPLGVMALIDLAYSGVELSEETTLREIAPVSLAGKRAVVIGRSQLVGKPVGIMLLERNATVTFAHSKTPQIADLVRSCDIVVAAVGVPELVRSDWIKPGAVVIDVGINRLDDKRLVGDVKFDEVAPLASAITPVPGGVGPMTVAMLMSNTVGNWLRSQRECV